MPPSTSSSRTTSSATGTVPAQPRRGRIPLPSLSLRISERKLLLLLIDLALLNLVLLWVVAWTFPLPLSAALQVKWYITMGVVWLTVAHLFDVYNLTHAADPWGIARRMVATVAVAVLVYVFIPFITPSLDARRYFFALLVLAVGSMTLWRVFYAAVFVQPWFVQRAVVVGAGVAGHELAATLAYGASSGRCRSGVGYEILAYIDDLQSKWGSKVGHAPVVGGYEKLCPLVRQWEVDEVILAITHRHSIQPALMTALIACSEQGVRVTTMAAFYERLFSRLPVTHLGGDVTQVLNMHEATTDRFYLLFRRIMDLLLCIPMLLVLALVMPVIALANRFCVPGPLFYRQTRIGQGGRAFAIVKFRTMLPNAEAVTGAVWAADNDPRITPVGRWLRKTRLDEIPQVLNILAGQMSFIGPRPERPEFVEDLVTHLPFYRARHGIRPGLTGWAQVQYGYGNNVDDARMKLEYDLYYLKHMNVLIDLQILVRTAAIVFQLRGK